MKKLLITGGTGWFGKKLISYYYNKYDISIISRNEKNQWIIKQNFSKVNCILHDIRNKLEFENDHDIIIHAAALKHVLTGIEFPVEVVDTNIIGTINVLNFAAKNNSKFIYISTDKAVESNNLYGATKYIGEKLTENYKQKGLNATICRFGNLFGSSGSIIEILIKNYIWGIKEFDISDENAERYFLKWQEAARLIDEAIKIDELLVIGKYKSIRILDLVKLVIPDVKINVVGLRPGEKLREKLYLDKEVKRKYYSNEEILAMWEEARAHEIGDYLT